MKGARRRSQTSTEEPTEAPRETEPPKTVDRERLRVRAVGLVARAAHQGTPEEEARTSAFVAAKLIHEEKFLEVPVRHALLERLDGLDDSTLDGLAVLVEEALDAGSVARVVGQSVRWRNEAKHLQLKLDAFAGALRWILQGYKLGLSERPGHCGFCTRALLLGDIVVWKRRRSDAVHYSCCVMALQQQGAIQV